MLASVPTGKVYITGTPEGALIYEKGQSLGSIPATIILPAGEHELVIKKDGYKSKTVKVRVDEGAELLVEVNLKKIPKPGEIWRDPYLGMEFVWIPGGCFEMGCGSWQKRCGKDEKPLHKVCLKGFWIGKYEVTFSQFWEFLSQVEYHGKGRPVLHCNDFAEPEDFTPEANLPVVCVSWYDAMAFAEWLSKVTGYKFSLPTEAQWEYACRSAGKKEIFSGSNSWNKVARCFWNAATVYPVGSKKPNAFGIYDMSGNVWEWCMDWYQKDYYKHSPLWNPSGPERGKKKVIRGGSWEEFPYNARCSNRARAWPIDWKHNLGFRLIRVEE